jgi:hypothetical protein
MKSSKEAEFRLKRCINLAPTAGVFLCNHTVVGPNINKSGDRNCQWGR